MYCDLTALASHVPFQLCRVGELQLPAEATFSHICSQSTKCSQTEAPEGTFASISRRPAFQTLRKSCSRIRARLQHVLIYLTMFPATLSTKLLEETAQENYLGFSAFCLTSPCFLPLKHVYARVDTSIYIYTCSSPAFLPLPPGPGAPLAT